MTTQTESEVVSVTKVDEENPSKTETTINDETKINEPSPLNPTEKPKRAGRKKRELSSTSDLNNEVMDTQPLFEQPIIIEGKRSRKPTSRLELTELTPPKKEFSIPQGHGKKLGEIPFIDFQISNGSNDALSNLHSICFGHRGTKTNLRKNLRDFKGFEFSEGTDEYQRHLTVVEKLKTDQLNSICDVLGLSLIDRPSEQGKEILNFLLKPTDCGKSIPERKSSTRLSQKTSGNSKDVDLNENKLQNGNDEDEAYFDDDEEEFIESDEDYIGSDDDDEMDVTNNDDPDDFVYQPGKKAPKRKSPLKRSRSSTRNKRKRVPSASTKRRGRKAQNVQRTKQEEEEEENHSTTEPTEKTSHETNENLKKVEIKESVETKSTEETMTPSNTDIIPETR